jgi:hypothetical protein
MAVAGPAVAGSVTVTIPMEAVTVKSGERGECYIVKFDLPADLAGKRLDGVFIDFVVDASPRSEDEAEATRLVGVFPLTAEPTGATLQYESDIPSVHPIAMGEDRRVRVDITGIVNGWIANPSSNHGLVIGALTGPDVGTVSLASAGLGPATAVRVTFFYQNRSGGRVSTK